MHNHDTSIKKGGKMRNILLISIVISYIISFSLKAQQYNQEEKEDSSFLQSTIRFENSSLEEIVLHPDSVLADPDAFWANDSAYQLYKLWHQFVSIPIDMDKWKERMRPLVNTPIKERNKNSQLMLSRNMLKKEKEFNEKAIPFLYSFLPKNCPPINPTIYFTTAILTSGFQMENDVVIYGENADKENLFIHELFHRCQRACSTISGKNESKDTELDQIYFFLWIEGTATYVGYKALEEFPSVDPLTQNDYKLFEDSLNISRLREKLNEVLKKAPSLVGTETGQEELRNNLMQVGGMDRAFYIVGCYMAATIDEKLGRDALKETLINGPQYYLQKYNSLVDEKLKVFDLYAQKEK